MQQQKQQEMDEDDSGDDSGEKEAKLCASPSPSRHLGRREGGGGAPRTMINAGCCKLTCSSPSCEVLSCSPERWADVDSSIAKDGWWSRAREDGREKQSSRGDGGIGLLDHHGSKPVDDLGDLDEFEDCDDGHGDDTDDDFRSGLILRLAWFPPDPPPPLRLLDVRRGGGDAKDSPLRGSPHRQGKGVEGRRGELVCGIGPNWHQHRYLY